MHQKRKTPISDIEIGRRLADYPPEFLYHLGLIPTEEFVRLSNRDSFRVEKPRYRRSVAFS